MKIFSLNFLIFLWLFPNASKSCSTTGFDLVECGSVGETTTVRTKFFPTRRYDIVADWGDGTPITFQSFNATMEDEQIQFLQHNYTEAGRYQPAFDITGHFNLSDSPCILYKTQLTLDVSEKDCKETVNWSSAGVSQSATVATTSLLTLLGWAAVTI